MYQSLYRKYRPTNFDEVVGQDIVKNTLSNSIKNNTISHAYLFTGPRGTGKTSIAKILAKTVNCLNVIDSHACDKCDNCVQYINKQSNDIIEIDAASNNGVDEIRDLKNKILTVPSGGKYKVYIIDEVHMLTVGAFNALLKTLEEPPKHVIFILATTEPHKIPATILSRCQRFDFKKISTKQIADHLKNISILENVKISDDALFELARLADGGMRDAFSLLEQAISYCSDEITLDIIHQINGTISQESLKTLFDALINKDIEKIFNIIDEYDNNGKNLVKIMDEFIIFLRNILLQKEAPNYLKEKIENIDLYKEEEKNVSLEQLIKYLDILNKNMNEMKLSSNPRLNMELNFVNIINLDAIKMNNQNNYKCEYEKKLEKAKTKIETQAIIKKENTNFLDKDILKKLINIRVNNTLCNFDKKLFLNIKNDIDKINQFILIPELSKVANILLNGELKAANEKYFIFNYKYENERNEFLESIKDIESLLEKIYNRQVKTIAVIDSEWDQIKKDFNGHNKKFEFVNEDEDLINNLIKNNENDIEKSFGNIVKYD